jgi:predicted ribosomally synthesized peptide with SipW-like signal peptide
MQMVHWRHGAASFLTTGCPMSIASRNARSTARKLLSTVCALGIAGGVAALGTWAAFTSTTSASTQVDSGTMSATLGAAGSTANRLTVGATGLAPGDTMQRVVTLSNAGDVDWASAALTTTASTSSLLDTDTVDGLQAQLDQCSVPWTEAGSAPAYTYTCAGTSATVVASRPVIESDIDLGVLNSLVGGGSDFLRVTLALPSTAGNSFQAQSSTIEFAFDAIQRTGSDH